MNNFVPVIGLDYHTQTIKGKTDHCGTFKYELGETVSFSIGNITIGSSQGKNVVTPFDMILNSNGFFYWNVINISRFLQSIDRDRDFTNGIEIPECTYDVSAQKLIDFNAPESEFVSSVSDYLSLLQMDSTVIDAKTIFKNMLQVIKELKTKKTITFDTDTYFRLTDNTLINEKFGLTITNPYYFSISPNYQTAIYSKVQLNKAPEIFLQNRNGAVTQLTDNEFIEICPVVSDKGDYAFALSEFSTSQTKLFLNGLQISDVNDGGLFNHLAMNDSFLASGYEDFANDSHYLFLYNLTEKSFSKISVPGFIQKIGFLNTDKLLIQVFDPVKKSLDIYTYDPQNLLSAFAICEKSKFFHIYNDGTFRTYSVDGDSDALLFFYALYLFKNYQLGNPFSRSNNFLGRITWNESYLLEGLIKFYRLTSESYFKDLINNAVQALLSSTNQYVLPEFTELPPFLWATKKYSLDKSTPINLLVNDTIVIYTLLLAVNEGLVDDETKIIIIELAKSAYEYFEKDYNSSEKLYRIQYGIKFWADGVWMPYNQQNSIALMLIELYKATEKIEYRERAKELAQKFRSEWIETDDGRILWHYWPNLFYKGWSAQDKISLNTPVRTPTSDVLFEDISHAGHNLKFVIEYRKFFGNSIFSDDDMVKINNTIKHIIKNDTFSAFMSGDVEYFTSKYRYLPRYGWSEIKNQELSPYYKYYLPQIYPDFDSMWDIVTYLDAIQSDIKSKQLTLISDYFRTDGAFLGRISDTLQYQDILDYFDIGDAPEHVLSLTDVIIILKLMSGNDCPNHTLVDFNSDGRIGIEEALYILFKLSE